MRDLYSVMGLSRRATSDEIKAAYRALAKRYHPDVNAGDEEGEWRTKEINRAYTTLGDPEARVAYDLELAHQRAAARRGFWRSAAIGAATCILMASSVGLLTVWRQNASILQSQEAEPAVLVGDESPSRAQPAQVVDSRGSAAGGRDGHEAPSETVIASVPGLFGEPPSFAAREMRSAPRADGERQPAASASTTEPSPPEKIVSAPSPEQGQLPQAQEVLPVPGQDAPLRTELASAAPPEIAAVQPMPAPAIDAKPGRESPPGDAAQSSEPAQSAQGREEGREPAPAQNTPPRTELANAAPPGVAAERPNPLSAAGPRPGRNSTRVDANRKPAAGGRTATKSNRQPGATEAARSTQSAQGSDREPRLVSKTAAAMRWPSADEPFVNVGGRNR
jgi:curved DNA-binding protein CbpA